MKPREERHKTLIRARMRSVAGWSDVCILNLSLHGAGMQCASPPGRGTYVEIRRGGHVIIARVAWSNGHRFGVRSQEAIAIEAVIAEPRAGDPAAARPAAQPFERRARPRAQPRHDASRQVGRAAEFACIALFGAGAAIALYGIVEEALARPAMAITAAMKVDG